MRSALAQLGHPKIAIPFLCYAGWIGLLIWIGDQISLWRLSFTKDTIVWATTVGLWRVVNLEAAQEPGYVKDSIVKAAGFAAFLQYIVTFSTLHIILELFLQPLVLVVAVAPIVSETEHDREMWSHASPRILGLIAIALLANTVLDIYSVRATLDWGLFIKRALWPAWLALGLLPFIYALALYASYEIAFLKLRWSRQEDSGLWKAKLGLVLAFHIRLQAIHAAEKGGTYEVANASTVSEAMDAATRFRRDQLGG